MCQNETIWDVGKFGTLCLIYRYQNQRRSIVFFLQRPVNFVTLELLYTDITHVVPLHCPPCSCYRILSE